jgi:5'-nucleotidase
MDFMTNRPLLLITNDDGISAPGIRHLWASVKDHADVVIVAPRHEKSGCGLSITYTKPLMVEESIWIPDPKVAAWSLNGTPADCVKMAVNVLLKRRPDMIISGINNGSNAGRTVLYSGTIGGVIEGVLKDIPGIAFSFCDSDLPSVEATQPYVFPLIQHFLEHPLPLGSLLNVNFPLDFYKNGAKGFKLTRQGRGCWLESPDCRSHPLGMPYYWLGGKWTSMDNEHPDSDVYWLDRGYVTAVPIHVGELTDAHSLAQHKNSIERKLNGSGEQSHQSEIVV